MSRASASCGAVCAAAAAGTSVAARAASLVAFMRIDPPSLELPHALFQRDEPCGGCRAARFQAAPRELARQCYRGGAGDGAAVAAFGADLPLAHQLAP